MRESEGGNKSLQSVPEISLEKEKSQVSLPKELKCKRFLTHHLVPCLRASFTHTHFTHTYVSNRKELRKCNFILILSMLQTPILIINNCTQTIALFASLLGANNGEKIKKRRRKIRVLSALKVCIIFHFAF